MCKGMYLVDTKNENIILKKRILIMGVAGSGKTTLGTLLSKEIKSIFVDADSFHSQTSIENMRNGIPVTSEARKKWLKSLFEHFSTLNTSYPLVVACSALTNESQKMFKDCGFFLIFLNGDYKTIETRIKNRADHFFSPNLLKNQFSTIETPRADLCLDIKFSPKELIEKILKEIRNSI